MIRPVRFESNPMTADSNRFQGKFQATANEQQQAAVAEFDVLVATLRDAGVQVLVVQDTAEPHTPDSIFPNNWFSTHSDGRAVLYPMEAPNRRLERRNDVFDVLAQQNFDVRELLDLSVHEDRGHYLEGTGSLVLDRENRIAYACLSTRTHLDPLGEFSQRLGYEVVAFDAVDRDGTAIYHTNVMLSIAEEVALICADAIVDQQQRTSVICRLKDTGHEVVELTQSQMEAFAGNALALRTQSDERLIVMSKSAYDVLAEKQRQQLGRSNRLLYVPINAIEKSAGGSVRCMLAEIHLPERTDSK